LPAADFLVVPGDLIPELLVGHGDDPSGLFAHTAGGIESGLNDLVKQFLLNHIWLKLPDAPAIQHVSYGLVHLNFSFSLFFVIDSLNLENYWPRTLGAAGNHRIFRPPQYIILLHYIIKRSS